MRMAISLDCKKELTVSVYGIYRETNFVLSDSHFNSTGTHRTSVLRALLLKVLCSPRALNPILKIFSNSDS